jgi:1-acyl-sn-glycerol-3-phosphate acyltransferase
MRPPAVPDTPTVLGPNVPRRGNFFSRALARLLLRILGFRMVGNPPDAAKFIVTAAPHTSNMDGLLLLFGAFSVGFDQHWVLKHTMFQGWRGPILRWTGAVSVNRKQAGGMVQQVLEQFQTRDRFVLIVAPEGTRTRVETWKSGFHRIAVKAGVPVCLGFICYERRLVGFGPTFVPGDNFRADIDQMTAFYRQITPKHPELFALPRALAE